MTSMTCSDEAYTDYPSEPPESSYAKSGRVGTACLPRCLDVFPAANRQPLIPKMSRDAMPSHPTGIQGGRDGIASLPPDPGTKKPRRKRGLCGDAYD